VIPSHLLGVPALIRYSVVINSGPALLLPAVYPYVRPLRPCTTRSRDPCNDVGHYSPAKAGSRPMDTCRCVLMQPELPVLPTLH
jgi:hypothetical protein